MQLVPSNCRGVWTQVYHDLHLNFAPVMEAHLQGLQGKPMCSNLVCETARYRGTTPLTIYLLFLLCIFLLLFVDNGPVWIPHSRPGSPGPSHAWRVSTWFFYVLAPRLRSPDLVFWRTRLFLKLWHVALQIGWRPF
jgi:hypothetical protein